jgi:lipopolysaccharide transport system ATP-binding protein
MPTAIKFENISKQYRLGYVSTRTISHDLNRWWQTSILRKEDPYLMIGSVNDRATKADSDYVWALRNISFDVEQGDVVGIIGKNGAGKSTLLKILSKVTSPTTGTIKAKGRIASLLEIGTGFHPELTGRENVFMNGAIMGMTKTEITRKFDEIVDFSGVERYIDTPVKRYSSGMNVRLGFAVAAFLEPEILVVDEVLAVGDAEFQKKAIGKMQNISHGDGRTVLFVSHNMASIRQLCSKGFLLTDGIISYSGEIGNTIARYLESSLPQNNLFIESITFKVNYIKVNKVEINKKGENPILLHYPNNSLEIHIEGELNIPTKIGLEIRIYDKNQTPLAFYSPSHYKGYTPDYIAGKFSIREELFLPKEINKGVYYLSLYLTDPGIVVHFAMERTIIIEIEGFPTKTGHVFEYDRGAGFLFLK